MASGLPDLEQVDAAIAALTRGERVARVRYADREVEYQATELDDLIRIRGLLQGEATTRPRAYRVIAGTGL